MTTYHPLNEPPHPRGYCEPEEPHVDAEELWTSPRRDARSEPLVDENAVTDMLSFVIMAILFICVCGLLVPFLFIVVSRLSAVYVHYFRHVLAWFN